MDRNETSVRGLSTEKSCDTIGADMQHLTDSELERLERQLKPLLNTVLSLRGKLSAAPSNGPGFPVDILSNVSKTFPVTAITVRWGASRVEVDMADLISAKDPVALIRQRFS